jgi:hypothetical protein
VWFVTVLLYIRCPDKDGEKPEVSDYHKAKAARNLGKYVGTIFGRPLLARD